LARLGEHAVRGEIGGGTGWDNAPGHQLGIEEGPETSHPLGNPVVSDLTHLDRHRTIGRGQHGRRAPGWRVVFGQFEIIGHGLCNLVDMFGWS
jgi:hypothetical protein